MICKKQKSNDRVSHATHAKSTYNSKVLFGSNPLPTSTGTMKFIGSSGSSPGIAANNQI
jgi:hypothetical protein